MGDELKVDDVIEVRQGAFDGARWVPDVVRWVYGGRFATWRDLEIPLIDEGTGWRRRPTYDQGRADERAAVTRLRALAENIRVTFDCVGTPDGDEPQPGDEDFDHHAYDQSSSTPGGGPGEGCLHCMAVAALGDAIARGEHEKKEGDRG